MVNLAHMVRKLADYLSDEISYDKLEEENALLRGEVAELKMTVEYLRLLCNRG